MFCTMTVCSLLHYSTTLLYYTTLLHYSITLLAYTTLLHYYTTLLYYITRLHYYNCAEGEELAKFGPSKAVPGLSDEQLQRKVAAGDAAAGDDERGHEDPTGRREGVRSAAAGALENCIREAQAFLQQVNS